MTHFEIVHDFDADATRFWRIFFDDTYNDALYDRLKVKDYRRLDRKEDDGTIRFSVRVLPARDLPGFVKKIVGGDLGYTEISCYYKGKDYLDVVVEPTMMKERTKIKAVYSLKPLAPGRVRRTFAGDISVDIPLLGRKIEQFVIDDMRKSYDVAAEVTAEWLKRPA